MTRQTMVQLTEELVESLDDEAGRRHVSRSLVIREAIQEHIVRNGDDLLSSRIVEGYERIPQATPDEWGSLEQGADVSVREVLQRLDAEECAQGLGSW